MKMMGRRRKILQDTLLRLECGPQKLKFPQRYPSNHRPKMTEDRPFKTLTSCCGQPSLSKHLLDRIEWTPFSFAPFPFWGGNGHPWYTLVNKIALSAASPSSQLALLGQHLGQRHVQYLPHPKPTGYIMVCPHDVHKSLSSQVSKYLIDS